MAEKTSKLRFTENVPAERTSHFRRSAARFAESTVSGTTQGKISGQNEDDNAAVEAANASVGAVETGTRVLHRSLYGRKLKFHKKAESPEDSSNPFSRMQQKRAIRREYAVSKHAEQAAANAGGMTTKGISAGKTIRQRLSALGNNAFEYISAHSHVILFIIVSALLFMVVAASFSSCSVFFSGGSGAVIATTFTAEDDDIIGANNDYKALEADLQQQIDDIESANPGYDEYRYSLDEIGHDPYRLAAYLTVLFEDYTRDEVRPTLQTLFNRQYELDSEEEVEIRTRTKTCTATHTDPETGETTEEEYEVEVEYEYRILNVVLINKGLENVIADSGGMNEDQAERYQILLQTKGNKAELFADDSYAAGVAVEGEIK